jgi:hypothetical protein
MTPVITYNTFMIFLHQPLTNDNQSVGEREKKDGQSEVDQIAHTKPPFELSVCSPRSKKGQGGWEKGQEKIKMIPDADSPPAKTSNP